VSVRTLAPLARYLAARRASIEATAVSQIFEPLSSADIDGGCGGRVDRSDSAGFPGANRRPGPLGFFGVVSPFFTGDGHMCDTPVMTTISTAILQLTLGQGRITGDQPIDAVLRTTKHLSLSASKSEY
jgi:hypothetical protein